MSSKTRSSNRKALNGKLKSSSTEQTLGIDINLYRKSIEYQMTPDMNWSKIDIDHVKPICMFDVSKDDEIKAKFSLKFTQPLLKHDHQLKGTKFNFIDYHLQFIKAQRFLKLNEERIKQNLHQWSLFAVSSKDF